MFNMLTTCYLFLGGTGAGALVVLSALECANARESRSPSTARGSIADTGPSDTNRNANPASRARARIRHALTLPDDCFARCWPLCFIALATGMFCLLVDLGRPDRLINLLLSPAPSAIAIGSYTLVASLVCAGLFSVFALFDLPHIPASATAILAFFGIIVGLVTIAYTGVLLQTMASVLFWQTWLLPALFVLSSLSCGIAVVLLGVAFVETRRPFIRPIIWLSHIDGILILIEAGFLAVYLSWAHAGTETAPAADALLFGDLAWLFWAGLVVCGLAIPFAMEQFVTHGNYRTQLLWIAAFLLAGGFILRFCIAGTADYDITQISDLHYGLTLLN